MGLLSKILLSGILVNVYTSGHMVVSHPAIVRGVVVDSHSRLPLPKAYVYIISGEEEAMTDSQGRFNISTWQSFPLTLTVTCPGYQKTGIRVEDEETRHTIRMIPGPK